MTGRIDVIEPFQDAQEPLFQVCDQPFELAQRVKGALKSFYFNRAGTVAGGFEPCRVSLTVFRICKIMLRPFPS